MKARSIAAAGLIIASLGISGAASAQAWGPPPHPPYGFAPPPPLGPPPPLPGPHVVEKLQWGQPGFRPYAPHCWTEYRNNGWEMVKVYQ